jgi:hypothetical protein
MPDRFGLESVPDRTGWADRERTTGVIEQPFGIMLHMKSLFSGLLSVHYGQAYVESASPFESDLEASFRGQQNGLCGASVIGALFLITGLHTGQVSFEVELCNSEPVVDESWEEIVEVPYRVDEGPVTLVEWAAQATYPLAIPEGSFRARYCARNMQPAADTDTILAGEPPIDAYFLSFWPAEQWQPDSVLKQTSPVAAYWHDFARGLTA